MFKIGITGPSGAGKGAVSDYFRSKGVNVFDADAVYHKIITPPSACLDELVKNFGVAILNESGYLNRAALAKLVFGEENKTKLLLLNSITHKYVIDYIDNAISELNKNGVKICAVDAPLLIESGISDTCDLIISVLADKNLRIQRIMERDSIDFTAASRRTD